MFGMDKRELSFREKLQEIQSGDSSTTVIARPNQKIVQKKRKDKYHSLQIICH